MVGLEALPKGADGDYAYTTQFEVTAFAAGPVNSTVFVEAENRGGLIFISLLDHIGVGGLPSSASYPVGLGNGFPPNHHASWPPGCSGRPASPRGFRIRLKVGEVVVRDFARLLAGDRHALASGALPAGFGPYKTRIIGGISQSAWFVNTFIAEGFN